MFNFEKNLTMKVVLDIKNELDLTVLLPLLERLKIPFSIPQKGVEEKLAKSSPASNAKNYDAAKLEALFSDLQQMKAFAQIEDPSDWQRKIRDEWN